MSATIASPTVAYQEYADREVKWLGLLPGHWKPQRLGTIAEMRVSNVDKHSKEEELPVRLCNYVDVYKNDHISRDMPFMRATASTEEIGRFRLRKYDVLITKDSETWDDIGVPALVTEPADDLISGYHLALLRPNGDILGPYLFRTLQSRGVAQQFHIGANGVTRYGLTHNTIRSVILPLPPLDEQAAIVRYLDDADQRIRAYVSAKERLIALLEEERQAVIHQAVTKGLDPNVKLKPSGVEWLGEVPDHWEVRRVRTLGQAIIGLTYSPQDMTDAGEGKLVLRASNISGGRVVNADNVYVRCAVPDKLLVTEGDILICSRSGSRNLIGKNARIDSKSEGVTFGAFMTVLRGPNNDYLHQVFNSKLFEYQSGAFLTSTINQLTLGILNDMKIPFPPAKERETILDHLKGSTGDLEADIDRASRQIELMEEYRTRLIADVVTGKLDVREAKP